MGILENLEDLLAKGQDNLLLRYGLGNEYLKAGRFDEAAVHLRKALEFDANHSAAWKLLGLALTNAGTHEEAIRVYEQGIGVAEKKGDIQAAKEMAVFLKRLRKQ